MKYLSIIKNYFSGIKVKKIVKIFPLFSLLFISCNQINTNVTEFLEYWTENVVIGQYDIASPYEIKSDIKNVSAVNQIEIHVMLSNPKNYDLIVADGTTPMYQVSDGVNEEIATNKTIELSSDKNYIILKFNLSNETEEKDITINGNYQIIKGSEYFNQEYSFTFRQNSPPDDPRNLRNPTTAEIDGYHCVHFDYADQNLKRNNNLVYELSCYLLENGKFKLINTKKLRKEDSKSNSDFTYYFEEQEKSLQYDYVLTAYDSSGLKSTTISTSNSLGACFVQDPVIEFGSNGGLNGNKIEHNGIFYEILEYGGSYINYKVVNSNEDSDLTVKVNGISSSAMANLNEGYNTIEATVSKNLCYPVSIIKNVFVVKELKVPELKFYSDKTRTIEVNDSQDSEDSHFNGYRVYNVNLKSDGTSALYVKAFPAEEGSTITLLENSKPLLPINSLSIGPHTILIQVKKENMKTKNFAIDNIYIQGILSEPNYNFTGIQSGSNENDIPIYKFSYLTYDGMPGEIVSGNTGNTVSVKINGISADSNFILEPDKVNTIEVKQTRQYCKTNNNTKDIDVRIKPVNLQFHTTNGGGKGYFHMYITNFGADSFNLKGQIYVNNQHIFGYDKDKYGVAQNKWQFINDIDARGANLTFDSTKSIVKMKFNSVRRHMGAFQGDDLYFGEKECTRTIAEIKKGIDPDGNIATDDDGNIIDWTFYYSTIVGNNNRSIRPRLHFEVSE